MRNPIYGILSGPSGGVAGALYVARKAGFEDILTFDMGGTSTDVALCQDGEPTIGRETSISHFRIKVPSVNVHTVGAGGGSIAHVPELTKALRVGPQSAGADPGPASYGRGGDGADRDGCERRPRPPAAEAARRRDGARRRRGARLGADDRGRDGPRLRRGGGRGDPRDREREHGRRAATRLRPARPRPTRVRARRLRRRRPAPRERGRRDHGLLPRARPAGARVSSARSATSWPTSATSSRRRTSGCSAMPTRTRSARSSRGSASAPRAWLEAEGIDDDARTITYTRRHALPPAGLRDPGQRSSPTRPARARGPRGALQRAPRAALRLPDAGHGLRDRQPPRDRLGRGAEARAARRRSRRRRRVGRGHRGARDRLPGRAARRRRSTTARSSRRATASTARRS